MKNTDAEAMILALHAGTANAEQQHEAAHLILEAAPVMNDLADALAGSGLGGFGLSNTATRH